MTNRTFRITGVTQENENKKDIQALLKRVAAGYKREGLIQSWDGYTKEELLELGLDSSEFQD